MITYDDFKKVELKTAKVLKAERVEGSEKLIRLMVDCGDNEISSDDNPSAPIAETSFATGQASSGNKARQIIAGIGLKYRPENLIGKTIIIVANLEPRKLMGLESQGMLLAASNETEGPILLTVAEDIESGSEIR